MRNCLHFDSEAYFQHIDTQLKSTHNNTRQTKAKQTKKYFKTPTFDSLIQYQNLNLKTNDKITKNKNKILFLQNQPNNKMKIYLDVFVAKQN